MTNDFNTLSEQEFETLKEAIPLITILIAGADGDIDAKEKEWAVKVANIRTYSGPDVLRDFYVEVGKTFQQRLDVLIAELSHSTEDRNKDISERLSKLNPILAKLDQPLAATFYKDIKTLAKHVAKATGGFLGMWSISKEEAKWAKLSTVNPIEFPEIN